MASSLKSQISKISTLLDYECDVLLLSDLRLNGKGTALSKKIKLSHNFYFNSSKIKRGVGVMVKRSVNLELLNEHRDLDENIILLHVKVQNIELILGAVYGPNNDDQGFFLRLRDELNRYNHLPIILGGDWNLTYSSLPVGHNPDVLNMRSIPSHNRSRWNEELCRDVGISDPYRLKHPEEKEFTYCPAGKPAK